MDECTNIRHLKMSLPEQLILQFIAYDRDTTMCTILSNNKSLGKVKRRYAVRDIDVFKNDILCIIKDWLEISHSKSIAKVTDAYHSTVLEAAQICESKYRSTFKNSEVTVYIQ